MGGDFFFAGPREGSRGPAGTLARSASSLSNSALAARHGSRHHRRMHRPEHEGTADATVVEIVGRSSSHFTRVATMFAHELGVPFELVTVRDLTSSDPAMYGGNPALKIPSLRIGSSVVFGAENVCRRLAEHAGRSEDPRIVWPERATSDLVRCAQELTWHAMGAQVQLIVGVMLGGLPPESVVFTKTRTGLEGALAWLDANLARVLEELPQPRELSVLEVTLFCLIEHLDFRRTLASEVPPRLRQFATERGARASARKTPYRFDHPAAATQE